MNIAQAKEYIKDSVRLYLKKDEFGEYRIPVVRQRPIFLLGAPGVGKTAIMEQIAQELGIALVAYSMTHHTRQSALGLPLIVEKEYGGKTVSVSEYTMSEIIASVYETMEESGIREGILFLDEINCVSETLTPSMLQFLQYKVFGRHQVPEGWVIVTAGNPPEYNRSVREFDVVTMDRLKLLEVEADFESWKQYALERRIHLAVLSFLEIKDEYFYQVETTVKGKAYITARGWEDLSGILFLYEEEGMGADENLIGQYLRHDKAVREFAAYYDLYRKYKKDYRTEEILQGRFGEEVCRKASEASFDERLSLLFMLSDSVTLSVRNNLVNIDALQELKRILKTIHEKAEEDKEKPEIVLAKQKENLAKRLEAQKKAGALSEREQSKMRIVERFLKKSLEALQETDSFEAVKSLYAEKAAEVTAQNEEIKNRMHQMFSFTERAFAEGNELLILMTELTAGSDTSRFINTFGSEDYARHNEAFMIQDRQERLRQEIAAAEP